MKKIFTRVTALSLTFIFIAQLIPIKTFAMSNDEYNEAVDFIKSKGFHESYIVDYETIEDGIKFTLNYLPNGDLSYLKYISESDGTKLIIYEGDKQDEFVYKDNGHVYLNGERNNILENSLSVTNSATITPRVTVAVWNYPSLDQVPGYNYWSTQSFTTTSSLSPFSISIAGSMTIWTVAQLVAGGYGLGVAYTSIYHKFADALLQAAAAFGVSEAIAQVYNNRKYIYNPTTLQYLYEISTEGAILGRTITNGGTFYRLESYN